MDTQTSDSEARHGRRTAKTPVLDRLKERAARFIGAHEKLAAVGLAVLTAACLVLLFWFTTFAGFGSSADFIYSKF